MELLIVILNKEEFLNDVLSAFVEAGITKGTIIHSEGMGGILAYDMPVFAGLRQLMGDSKKHNNKTILALIKDDSVIPELKKILQDAGVDFARPGNGVMFSVPVKDVMGHNG